jgi:GTPase SAR1 family protein
MNAMTDELQKIANRMTMPGSSIVTVGDTGAGKSTLLNALLGETSVLPTNGMRACTASLIELSYNKDENGDPYAGEVEFVTRQEWEKEFDDLIDDMKQQDGSVSLREPDQKAPSYSSWCKLYAIYGDDYTSSTIDTGQRHPDGRKKYVNPSVEQLKRKLAFCTRVTQVCGTTQKVTAATAPDFKRKLERFMDSENDVTQGQFWPLVKRVKMTSRNWSLLKTGGKLVDAPGVRDDNAARDKVVKEYLREADGIWIVASINRAVNDKTAKKMLGESFRRELLMDGTHSQKAISSDL